MLTDELGVQLCNGVFDTRAWKVLRGFLGRLIFGRRRRILNLLDARLGAYTRHCRLIVSLAVQAIGHRMVPLSRGTPIVITLPV